MGISLLDMDNITIGFILDLIDDNNSEYSKANEPVEATTEVIDRFF